MPKLSHRQSDALREIKSFIREYGYAPTGYELAERMGIWQTGAINHIRALVRKGFINHTPNKARSITVV